MFHINYQSTHKFYLAYGSLLQAHYPLPTDYRNHGVVLSPRIKFFMVTLARICNHHSVDLPPITASTPQSYLAEFHILMWCGFEPHAQVCYRHSKRRTQDLNLQAFYSQRFSRPLPHHPDIRQIWQCSGTAIFEIAFATTLYSFVRTLYRLRQGSPLS